MERQPGQQERALSGDKFYVPGSVLRVAVDTAAPSAAGAEDHIDVFFNNSPVFRLEPNATARGVRPVMWFDSNTPLRSGWAWGQNYLEGGTTAFEASVGQGRSTPSARRSPSARSRTARSSSCSTGSIWREPRVRCRPGTGEAGR